MALAIRESNLQCGLWQMKNDTLAGFFGFWVLKMALAIGKTTTTLHKPFLVLTKAMKTLPI